MSSIKPRWLLPLLSIAFLLSAQVSLRRGDPPSPVSPVCQRVFMSCGRMLSDGEPLRLPDEFWFSVLERTLAEFKLNALDLLSVFCTDSELSDGRIRAEQCKQRCRAVVVQLQSKAWRQQALDAEE